MQSADAVPQVASTPLSTHALGAMTFAPDRTVPFVDLVYRAIEGSASIDDVRARLGELEKKHGVFLRTADDARPFIRDPDRFCARHLDPFLDDTHLTIAGGDFCNDVDVCDGSGAQLDATWRGWGEIVADWANRRRWPSGRAERWSYMDFYMDQGMELHRYCDFVRVVRAAIGVR